ncbi:hypothetical protein PM8797T_07984 [Gimesia maris DSM 8797]|nr:hypothetical protein PM8797T_07984 [Gimesia maris DSM 8797]
METTFNTWHSKTACQVTLKRI